MKYALKEEWHTLWRSRQLWIAIVGMCSLNWILAGYYMRLFPDEDIVYYFQLINVDAPMVVSYSICACAYAWIYCKEKQTNSITYIVPRIGIRNYVTIRTGIGFFAGFIVLFLGKIMFVYSASFFYPLLLENGSSIRQYAGEGWGLSKLLLQGNSWGYFVWTFGVQGLLAGVLCVAAQTFSLFVKYQAFVIGFPVVLNYLVYNYLDSFLHVPSCLSWLCIYDASNPYFSDGKQLVFTCIYTGVLILVLWCISYKHVKKEFS